MSNDNFAWSLRFLAIITTWGKRGLAQVRHWVFSAPLGLATDRRLASRTGKLRPKRLNPHSWRLTPLIRTAHKFLTSVREHVLRLVKERAVFLFKKLRFWLWGAFLLFGLFLGTFQGYALEQQQNRELRLQLEKSLLEYTEALRTFQEQKNASDTLLKQKEAQEASLNAKIQSLQKQLGRGQVSGSGRLISSYSPRWGSCGTTGYLGGQCVYGIAKWICVPPNMGNASEWDEYARRNGIRVSSIPAVGTVAQSDIGWAGHVALVIAVEGNQVKTRGMNEGGVWIVRERWSPVSAFEYIYF